MKKNCHFLIQTAFCIALSLLSSCTRTSDDLWNDTKTAGRHIQRGALALTGSSLDSRQICNRADFEGFDDGECRAPNYYATQAYQPPSYDETPVREYDFVPLEDQEGELAMNDYLHRQPRENPGDPGSSVPGIEAFRDPNTIPQLAGIFNNIYFGYDSSLIKGQDNLKTMHRIADYMRMHPDVYVFIEGHTDERGAQAYNYALGSRRANTVRDFLINDGVSADNLFTITYGKDRPVVMENHEEAFSKNRRAEFKVYVR